MAEQRQPHTPRDFAAGFENPFDALREARSAAARSNKAVLYLRESDPASLGSRRHGIMRGTIPQQRDDGQQFADYLGLEVVGEYLDLDQGDRWGRAVLQQMLRDLEAGKFHHIIIQHPDRLSRGTEVKQRFKDCVLAANGKYYYATMPLAHEDSISGEMTETMANVAAGMEKQRIRERTQSMRLRRAKSGKLIVGAFPKYGYTWVRDARMRVIDYAVDPETSPVVQEILTRVAQGDPVRQLVFDLNRRGVPTRGQVLKERGLLSPNQAQRVQNHWTRNQIAAIVYSPEYSGWHLNYHSVSSYSDAPHPLTGLPRPRPQRKQLLRRAETAYLPLDELREQYGEFLMPVPALVDEDIQQSAIARFQLQSAERQHAPNERSAGVSSDSGSSSAPRVPREVREDALLAGGYVRCAYCGHSMAVQRVKNTRNGQSDYFCTHVKARGWTGNACCPVASNNIAVKKLDTLVWNQLLTGLKEPAVLEALLTEASTTVSTMEAKTGRLADSAQTRLQRLETDMAALVQQTLDPNLKAVARSYLTERMNTLGDDIAQAKDSLAEEQERLANQQRVQERIAEVKYTVESMAAFLDHLDFAAKRNLLYAFGVQVYVWRGHDPENQTDPRRGGQRYILSTDFTGLNLGARLETDWEALEVRLTLPAVPLRRAAKQQPPRPDDKGVAVPLKRSTNIDTENNASNYSIANAFDMQELLGLTVAGGEAIPEPVTQTLAERAATAASSPSEDE